MRPSSRITHHASRITYHAVRITRRVSVLATALFASIPQLHGAFTVPPGFTVSQAAGEPQIRFPMFAVFDDKGRLFVTESSGGDLYKEITDQTRLCKVRLLEDRDRDGRFEQSTVFANKINFPMGLAWRAGKLYLADPPDLVTFEHSNADGQADTRKVIVTGFGHRDNGSLHGLTFGPDDWLYMTCGEPDGYKIARPDGSFLEGYTGALLRCRPDGTDIEVLCRGFVNLVEVIFTPAGEIIGTDNWFRWPSGGVRDALVHLVPGGLYPLHLKDIGTQHPRLGDPLPAVSLFPAVALSGLMRYEGGMFPGEMHGNLFAAEHNSRKVSRHVLVREGSTFRAEAHEFLSTDDPDFHPSDVLEAPDGSMLVLDTGSWYIHHCPTGRIRKSPATGGIYRVRFDGKSNPPDNPEHEIKVVWRRGTAELRAALTNANLNIAAAAARGLALRRDLEAAPLLLKLLSSPAPEVRCAGAEALAHCGNADALATIWRGLEAGPDRFFEHALTYAAHHLADAKALKAALNDGSARVQKAALLLLSQPPRAREDLDANAVLSRVHSPDESLRRTALQILQNRPEWTRAAHDLLDDWAKRESLPDSLRTGFRDLALAFKTNAQVQGILASAIKSGSPEVRIAALETVEQAALPKTPQVWIEPLRAAILDRSVRSHALKAARTLHTSSLDGTIAQVADDPNEANELRLQALGILIARTPKLTDERLRFIRQQLRGDPLAALAAADVLRRAHLDSEQLNAVLKALPAQSIVVPGSLIGSLRECTSPTSAEKLLDAIAPFASSLSIAEVAALETKLPPEVRPRLQQFVARHSNAATSSHAKLEKFAALLEGGDPQRGRAVFFDARMACATCHAIGSEGGRIGPDLTTVGAIRSGRDILESILLPSSTFAQTYEPYLVVTADGRELTGTLARQEADSVLLREVTGSELQLPRSVIRELRRQEISIMPEGLESGLSEREFRDLNAFLQSLK